MQYHPSMIFTPVQKRQGFFLCKSGTCIGENMKGLYKSTFYHSHWAF